jgi:hypothetical protein
MHPNRLLDAGELIGRPEAGAAIRARLNRVVTHDDDPLQRWATEATAAGVRRFGKRVAVASADMGSPYGRWGWETVVFGGATGVALLHALDDPFLSRQPGVDLGQHVVAAVIALAAGGAAIVAFPRLRPGLRALLACVLGVLALANGAQHTSFTSRRARLRPAT